jgi:hypothetical protein
LVPKYGSKPSPPCTTARSGRLRFTRRPETVPGAYGYRNPNVFSEHLTVEASQVPIEFGIDEMLERLNDRYRWPVRYHDGQPSVEVILEDGDKTDVLFSAKDKYLIPELVHEYYNNGYTILVSRVQQIHKDVIRLSNIVNNFCGCEVNINAYFGRGTKSVSFPPHQHEYAVLVKNVTGVSEWLIDNRSKTLKDQDVLYFDAFIDHAVTKIIEPKFTLTCNLVRNNNV